MTKQELLERVQNRIPTLNAAVRAAVVGKNVDGTEYRSASSAACMKSRYLKDLDMLRLLKVLLEHSDDFEITDARMLQVIRRLTDES